jgi:hypothetical protein
MAACTPSIHVFLGRPLFLLSLGIHAIINFGILSSGILLTWSHNCSLSFSMNLRTVIYFCRLKTFCMDYPVVVGLGTEMSLGPLQ